MGTPIINLPQTGNWIHAPYESDELILFIAVLGLHAIKEKPVAINGNVEIRPVCSILHDYLRSLMQIQMMYLALTYDHRMLDGREAVVFLVKVRNLPLLFRLDAYTDPDL